MLLFRPAEYGTIAALLLCRAPQFSLDDSSATVTMGSTRVTAVITATLEAPYPDRPSEVSTTGTTAYLSRATWCRSEPVAITQLAKQWGRQPGRQAVIKGRSRAACVPCAQGSVRFNVECSPMASPAFDAGRPGPLAVQLARLVERALKQSGALDCEALCVIAGRKVRASMPPHVHEMESTLYGHSCSCLRGC